MYSDFCKVMELGKYYNHLTFCLGCMVCTRFKETDIINCPMYGYRKFKSYSGTGILRMAKAIAEGLIDVSEKVAEVIYYCTECAACVIQCKEHVGAIHLVNEYFDHMTILEDLKSLCVEKGALRIPAHRNSLESLASYGNPFGVAKKEERLRWIDGLGFKVKIMPKEKADVLLYVGSMYALEPTIRDTIKSIARVLNAAEIDFGILEEEVDDGLYAIQLGEKALFEELAKKNIKTFNELGVNAVVTPDPHPYNAFKNYYQHIGRIGPEVLHITEFVDELISDGKIRLKKAQNEVVTYHDPCNLGRKCGVYDAPRSIISAIKGLDFREMMRTREYAWCCGAGGGVMAAYPDFMMWTAKKRIEEAEGSGASTLITACPWCEYSFKNALEATKSALKVKNIIEFVQEVMENK
ncbi:MAG: (Fe-S)-binding protein [Candidatus Bathyarchaeia archaeon]